MKSIEWLDFDEANKRCYNGEHGMDPLFALCIKNVVVHKTLAFEKGHIYPANIREGTVRSNYYKTFMMNGKHDFRYHFKYAYQLHINYVESENDNLNLKIM